MTPEEIATHAAEVERWRAARLAALRRPLGWLSLSGLDWLAEGVHTLGTDNDADLVLSYGPRLAGRLLVRDGTVTLDPAAGAGWERDRTPVEEPLALRDDDEGDPTLLALGPLRFIVIRRGDRLALRTWNTQAELLEQFDGIPAYPIDVGWRIVGHFEPADAARTIAVPDVTGMVAPEPSPGRVTFTMAGGEHRLDALPGGEDGELWLIFGDATNGTTTYPGGRFLYTDAPTGDGRVIVDFNRAYNPPCVFTPYATCPLPPAGNRLEIAVEAGERAWRLEDGAAGVRHGTSEG